MRTQVQARAGSFWRTAQAVGWSLIGLRGRQGHEQDVRSIAPLHLVAMGLAALFVFVGALMALVHWVV